MILLDTYVVSEVMTPSPSVQVLDWLDSQRSSDLYLSTVTIAEIGFGLAVLPAGKRRQDLQHRFERFVTQGFEQRILSFDAMAARLYGEVMGHRRALGRPLSSLDGQIASIALVQQQAIATRNVRDFEDCGLEVIDPFAK